MTVVCWSNVELMVQYRAEEHTDYIPQDHLQIHLRDRHVGTRQ